MNNRLTAISYLKLIFWGALAVGIVFFISAALISCKKDAEEPLPAPPIISSFSPTSGNAPDGGLSGTLITISGSNFSTTASENEIKFNETETIADAATATQLTATVPAGATTGKITVTVNGQTATSATDFVVLQLPTLTLPTITSFSPASGLAGATVTITGTNFSSTIASNTIKFNNTAAIVSAATDTQLTTTVPAGATTGKITVAVNGQTATSTSDFIVIQPPTLAGFTPAAAVAGTTLIITGTNFDLTPTSNTVKFNNTSAVVSAAIATQLTTTVPAGATTGKISVTVNGLTVSSVLDFTVLPTPTITNFAPLAELPGASLVITGTNFKTIPNENIVKVNGTLSTVTASTSTQLTVTIPVSATTGKVTVELNGTTATSVSDFEVLKDIPRNGLMLYYPFNNNFQEVLNGTFSFNSIASPPSFIQDRFSRNQQGLSFDGSQLQSAGIAGRIIPTTPWTISFWMKYLSLSGETAIMSSMLSSIGIDMFLTPVGTGYVIDIIGRNAGPPTILSAGNLTQGYLPTTIDWSNITITYDGSTCIIYNNGTIVDQTTRSFIVGTSYQFLFGYSRGTYFNGQMDDLIVYDRVLSSQEVTQLVQQTVSKY